jgi:transposase
MEIDLANLPTDTDALHVLVRSLAGAVKSQSLKIAQLEARIAKLKRMQFGQSSEKIAAEIEQLELELDEIHEEEGKHAAERPAAVQALVERPYRKPLPEHLPREDEVHKPACTCPNCGGVMRKLGEDVTEVLEYVPASFKVIRHVRPKLSCRICETIVQVPMPSLPIERGHPGPGLLAHVLVSKYADHLPLYRQSGIYAREGVDLERSTLADWVGRSVAFSTLLWKRCAAMFFPAMCCTATIRRCRCWRQVSARQRPADCGPMSAMADPMATSARLPLPTSTQPTAKASTRKTI